MIRRHHILFLGFLGFIISCSTTDNKAPNKSKEPNSTWIFTEMSVPNSNTYTPERYELGRHLFYDPIMSRDSSISCASCHKQEYAFADHNAFSDGVEGRNGTRNVPTLTNIGYNPYFNRDGGVPTLEMQVLVPIQEHNEFDFNIVLISERLQRDSFYTQLSRAAYQRIPDHYVITRALGVFQRSLISQNSKFDLYQKGEVELTPQERRGQSLFYSPQTGCSRCHTGIHMTNYAFENNGLLEMYTDKGRERITNKPEDQALFKVPTLRNIALTAPYMHNGMFNSLEEVINHYNTGGKAHPNKSDHIKPLYLSENEKKDLISFLHTLTDPSFVENPQFNNPW